MRLSKVSKRTQESLARVQGLVELLAEMKPASWGGRRRALLARAVSQLDSQAPAQQFMATLHVLAKSMGGKLVISVDVMPPEEMKAAQRRDFTRRVSVDELAEMVLQAALDNEEGDVSREFLEKALARLADKPAAEKIMAVGHWLALPYLTRQIAADLATVQFDTENVEARGLQTLDNGLSVLPVFAGGDWETWVMFVIYFDGEELRAYIPTDGNPWNTDTQMAYGNDEEADAANMDKRFPGQRAEKGEVNYDPAKMEADIVANISANIS